MCVTDPWHGIYSDFSGIFAELLPGKSAKLQLPKGQDVMQCLEMGDQLST
ncbi:hypothetical protein EDC04DRAFT_2594225 [Pisolithus marmoratus]|nr:hypothetical protein EDC04DRAFT_2594225 [Pisolithus marmoratus]